MKIVGIDPSLTSTGLAAVFLDGESHEVAVDRIKSKPVSSDLDARWERLYDIRVEIADWTRGADLVVVEGLAYASPSPFSAERAGLWWLVIDHELRRQVPVAVVPPAVRAKYATGRGNAGKDEVLAAVVRRYPAVEVTGNDEADALILAAMGARYLGEPIDDLPAANLAVVAKASWPQPAEEAS